MKVSEAQIGVRTQRLDAAAKITGKAKYQIDFDHESSLVAQILLSPVPHADLKVSTYKAQSIATVVTGADFSPKARIMATNRVLYAGEPVAAVATPSVDASIVAMDAVEIEYSELPAKLDIEEDVKNPEDVGRHIKVRHGNIEKGFDEAAFTVEGRYTMPMVQHCQMEPLSALAEPTDEGITIWMPCQSPNLSRSEIAEALMIKEDNVRIIVPPHIGGRFGNRGETDLGAICAKLALKAKKPVRLLLTREETFRASMVREGAIIYVKDAVTKEGKLTARYVKVLYDAGGYKAGLNRLLQNAAFAASSVYSVPNFAMDIYRVYTNRQPNGTVRAPLGPQIAFALESQMDRLAVDLGIDSVEFRRMNLLRDGETSSIGEKVNSLDMKGCLDAVAAALDWSAVRSPGEGRWKSGKGIALGSKQTGGNVTYSARVILRSDGVVEVATGAIEVGGGIQTAVAQLASEVLGIPVSRILINSLETGSDSLLSPQMGGCNASRQLYNIGNATVRASEDLLSKLKQHAAKALRAEAADVELDIGSLRATKKSSGEQLTLQRFLSPSLMGVNDWREEFSPLDLESSTARSERAVSFYTPAAEGVEVEVDTQTGQVRICRSVAVVDVGRAINPATVEGQIEGGMALGISVALHEEMVTENGKMVNTSFTDYKLLSSLEAPMTRSIIRETPHPFGPFGARGCGEAPVIPTGAAIANAVANATGARIVDYPITPEKVLKSLKS